MNHSKTGGKLQGKDAEDLYDFDKQEKIRKSSEKMNVEDCLKVETEGMQNGKMDTGS